MNVVSVFWTLILSGLIDNSVSLKIEACHGNTAPNYLTPKCKNSDEIIKLNGLYAIAKKTALGCPGVYNGFNGNPDKCCTYSAEDCKGVYTGVSEYYKYCVGKNTCNREAAWQAKTCNETDFMPQTNYMLMDYNCVPKHDILPITSNGARTGHSSSIGGPGYPNSSLPTNSDGTCSVLASCDTTINIIAIDINFQTDVGGMCQQYITIEDNGSITKRIDCGDNNPDKKTKTIYTSRGHFLILRYKNSLPVDGGQLWMEFNGTHKNANIEIRCGTSIMTSPPSAPSCLQKITSTISSLSSTVPTLSFVDPHFTVTTRPGVDPHFTVTTRPGVDPHSNVAAQSSTAVVRTDARSTDPENGLRLEASNDDGSEQSSIGLAAGIAVGLLVLILIIIVLLLLWRHKRKKRGKMSMKVSDSTVLPDAEFAAALGITGTIVSTGVAPPSSILPSGPKRLPPIRSPWNPISMTAVTSLTKPQGGGKKGWHSIAMTNPGVRGKSGWNTIAMTPTSSIIKQVSSGSDGSPGSYSMKTAVFELMTRKDEPEKIS